MARGFRLSEEQIQKELDGLESRLALIDMEKVAGESAKQTAADLTQVVRDSVATHPDIESPANLISEYYTGPGESSKGHPLTTKKAWEVEKVGRDYRVSPVKNVQRKAMLMEFGRGSITTRPDNPMRFWVGNRPIFTHEVGPVEPKYYWRAAVRKIRSDGKLSENMEEELRKEFQEKGFTGRR